MELTTARLVLRELAESDWHDVLDYQSDPLYLEYKVWTERSPSAVQRFIRTFVDQQRETPRTGYQFAITLASGRQLIGSCGIRMGSSGAPEANMGFELSPREWGHGYATEAALALLQFGFGRLRLHRIWSWCVTDNARSVRVLEKVGMRLEGRQREKECFKGRWWDVLLYAILEQEWRERR